MWTAGPDGVVSRIDPNTNRVDMRIPLDSARPVSLAVYHGDVFVGVERPLPPITGGGQLRITTTPDSIDSVDPAFARFAASWQMLYATGLNLVNYPDKPSPDGTHLAPDAAAAMPKVSDDGHTFTFVVRPGYRFAPTGLRVIAGDFRTAIERDLRLEHQTFFGGFAGVIAGAQQFIAGKAAHPSGIRVHDDTISITVTGNPAGFLPLLALPEFAAIPPDTPDRPMGSTPIPSAGPYYIRSYVPGHELVLAKNPYYPGPRPAVV